jgi:hypothetical protein
MSLVRLLTAGKSLVGLKDEQVRYRMTDPRAMPKFGSSRNPFQSKAAQLGGQDANAQVGPSGAGNSGSVARANRGLVVEAAGSSRSVSVELPLNGVCEPRRVSEVCGLDNSDSLRKSDAPRLTEPKKSNPAEHANDSEDVVGEAPRPSPQGEGEPETPALTSSGAADLKTSVGGEEDQRGGGLKEWISSFKSLFGVGQLRPGRKPGPARAVTQPVQGELRLENVKVLRNDLSDTDFEIVTRPARPHPQSAPPKANTEHSVPSESAWERVTTLFGAEK